VIYATASSHELPLAKFDLIFGFIRDRPAGAFGSEISVRKGGIIGLVIAAVVAGPVRADSWTQLPNGRVAIEINKVKLAFPTTGSEVDDIKFNNVNKAKPPYYLRLKDVIASPEIARQFFAGKLISVSVPNLSQRDGLFLGRFSRAEFDRINFAIVVGPNAQGNCEAWARIYDKYRVRMKADISPIQPDAWVEFVQGKSPKSWTYVRQSDRPGWPKYFDSFSCGFSDSCSASSCVGSHASFIYQFNRRVHTRETWESVAQNAKKIFDYFFIDEKERKGK
jgi:hypothetical protein